MKMNSSVKVYGTILLVLAMFAVLMAADLSAKRAKQDQAIADIRKGDFEVLVLDQDGSPTENCSVKFEQLKHDFHFGNAYNLSAFTNNKYLDTMAAYFNHGAHQWEFEWDETEPRQDQVTFEYANRVNAWAKSEGISMRAHAFAWGTSSNVPNWQSGLSQTALRAEMIERVWDVYDEFGDTTYTDYDIINEMVPGEFYQDEAGWAGVAAMYNLADSLFTGPVYMCEYDLADCGASHWRPAKTIYDNITDAGGVVQGFASQCHVIEGADNDDYDLHDEVMEDLWDTYGTRFKITEAIFSGSNQTTQANMLEGYLRSLFSHTSADGFVAWGVWQSGMTYSTSNYWWSSSWSPRPIVARYKSLVFDEWWSGNENETTGSNGIATGDVFYGTYKITVKSPGDEETKVVNSSVMTREDGTKQITVNLDGEYSDAPATRSAGLAANPVAMRINSRSNAQSVDFVITNGNSFNTNIAVYNVKGEKVWSKSVNKQYKITWNYGAGRRISSGTYFVRADVGKQQLQQRFVVLK